jgi:prepilin peptidase CpaA
MMTAQTAWSAAWFLPFAAPVALWAAWSDMARMKIPNKAVYALALVFLGVGLIALPLAEYPWRLTHLAVVLVVGFVLNLVGLLGAGDAKFAAAMAPFIALADAVLFAYVLAAALLAGFVTHRIAKRIPAIRKRTAEWESWKRRDYPMGLSLGGALILYLLMGVLYGG